MKINWHLIHDLLKTLLLAILVVYAAVNYENHQKEHKGNTYSYPQQTGEIEGYMPVRRTRWL